MGTNRSTIMTREVRCGKVRFLVRLKIFIHASQCPIVHEFFTALYHLKHCWYTYADCMTISGTHRIILSQRSITIMVRRTQEAVLCYWGQTQAWLHTLTEQPNFWTRAIRMWSHNSSHRANLNLWLRALSVLAYFVFVRMGAGRFFR